MGSVGIEGNTSSSEVQEVRMDKPGRVKDLAVAIIESDLPHRTMYEWVSPEGTCQFSKYRWSSMVESYVANVSMLADNAIEGELTQEHCITIGNICHG